jgi:hypothetical protein
MTVVALHAVPLVTVTDAILLIPQARSLAIARLVNASLRLLARASYLILSSEGQWLLVRRL